MSDSGNGHTQNSAKTKGLRPFVKGQSGNPGGRPKGMKEFAEEIRTFLASNVSKKSKKLRMRALIEKMYRKDWKTLLAYGFGKPIETHDVTLTNTLVGVPEDLVQRVQERAAMEARGN